VPQLGRQQQRLRPPEQAARRAAARQRVRPPPQRVQRARLRQQQRELCARAGARQARAARITSPC
jgi:hypothetical protein